MTSRTRFSKAQMTKPADASENDTVRKVIGSIIKISPTVKWPILEDDNKIKSRSSSTSSRGFVDSATKAEASNREKNLNSCPRVSEASV